MGVYISVCLHICWGVQISILLNYSFFCNFQSSTRPNKHKVSKVLRTQFSILGGFGRDFSKQGSRFIKTLESVFGSDTLQKLRLEILRSSQFTFEVQEQGVASFGLIEEDAE